MGSKAKNDIDMEYRIIEFIGDDVWYQVCRRSLCGWLPHNFDKYLPKGYVWEEREIAHGLTVPERFDSMDECRIFLQRKKTLSQKVVASEQLLVNYYWQHEDTGMVSMTVDPSPPSKRYYPISKDSYYAKCDESPFDESMLVDEKMMLDDRWANLE